MSARLFDLIRARFSFQFFAAFLTGSFSALAMAPANAWPVLFAGLSIAYILHALTQKARQSFLIGWAFGFGYFIFSLSWIGNALLVEGNAYVWAWPLAVAGLPALLAVFHGAAFALARRISAPRSALGYFTFATFWAGFEMLRGYAFTGFPWNLFAHGWVEVLPVLQIISASDVYILNWLTLLWAVLPGFLFYGATVKHRKALIAACIILSFAAVWGFGVHRLSQDINAARNVNIRIVQANIKQENKWRRDFLLNNLGQHLQLSVNTSESLQDPTIIVWPETALIDWMYQDSFVRREIVRMLQSYDEPAYLLTGMLRQNAAGGARNSLVMIGPDGAVLHTYDKHHLVPFGEYIPFQDLIPLAPITSFSGFSPGSGPQNFSTPEGITYAPAICYESIFSRSVLPHGQDRPDFIAVVTNDAWYGFSAGPYQHHVQSVFRAVEDGVPVVRSANTGISSFISPYGEVLVASNLFQPYFGLQKLPQKTETYVYAHEFCKIFFIFINLFLLIPARFLFFRK